MLLSLAERQHDPQHAEDKANDAVVKSFLQIYFAHF